MFTKWYIDQLIPRRNFVYKMSIQFVAIFCQNSATFPIFYIHLFSVFCADLTFFLPPTTYYRVFQAFLPPVQHVCQSQLHRLCYPRSIRQYHRHRWWPRRPASLPSFLHSNGHGHFNSVLPGTRKSAVKMTHRAAEEATRARPFADSA